MNRNERKKILEEFLPSLYSEISEYKWQYEVGDTERMFKYIYNMELLINNAKRACMK